MGDISDDWEFEETKVMQAQEELRSIRAKIAVLEGKMALEIMYALKINHLCFIFHLIPSNLLYYTICVIISERNKIIEDKQRRLDEVQKALSELRTVCIMWANPASEVLLVGSFDGWTSQVHTYSNLLFCLRNKIINKLQDIYSAHWYFIEFILINLRLFEEMMQNYVAYHNEIYC